MVMGPYNSMNSAIAQQLAMSARGNIQQAMQFAQIAQEQLYQMYGMDMMQPGPMPSPFGMPPYGYPGGIMPPQQYRQKPPPQGLNPPPRNQGWPNGTVQTQNGYVVQPGPGGSLEIFNPGASGPNDKAQLMFTVKNGEVQNADGKKVFDLGKGGSLTLPDGSQIAITTAGGRSNANIISGNASENVAWSSGGQYSANINPNGASAAKSQIQASSAGKNTYGVNFVDGQAKFYQLKGDTVEGAVTGQTGVSNEKLQATARTLVDNINATIGKIHGFTLDPDQLAGLIKGGNMNNFFKQLQLDMQQHGATEWNLSDLTNLGPMKNPSDVQNMLSKASADLLQHFHSHHTTKKTFAGMLQQLESGNPAQKWGGQTPTINTNNRNYIVSPPAPGSQTSANYPTQYQQNLQRMVQEGMISPQMYEAFMQGGGMGQYMGGMNYYGSSPYSQMNSLPNCYGTYNQYSSYGMNQGNYWA